ncbi:HAMP domain-containing sensor histidine kinase [Clostridium oceanicum]|uniref:histidine kinase n=1 Tax=Clostridium oceanicum TaxID=1543 RepID=A0ABN1JIJ2_9CLOT
MKRPRYNNLHMAEERKANDYEDNEKKDNLYELFCNNKNILDILSDAIIIYEDDKLKFINKKGLDILGVEKILDIEKNYITDIISMDNKKLHVLYERINLLKKGKNLDSNIYKIINEYNELFYFEVKGIYIKKKKKNVLIVVAKDITESKELKEKVSKLNEKISCNVEKTDILSDITHELRTPINIILSTIQLIDSYNNNQNYNISNFKKYTNIISQNCYRLVRLTNNIIDSSRIDKGFLNINIENYDIVKIVEDITLSIVPYTESKNIELIFDTNIEEKIMAFDAEKIERVMLNLLSNAVKFTPSNGKIYVNIYNRNNNLDISVKDTGIGISEDKKNEIFKKFKQGKLCNNGDYNEGSGIGLSLVKSIVEAHEGSVQVFSKENEGSEFVVTLPIKTLEKSYSSLYQKRNINHIVNIEFSDLKV